MKLTNQEHNPNGTETQAANDPLRTTNMSDKEYQRMLLPYIDVPYFRNNPAYLSQWRKFYEQTRDPQILLLMNYKQIGTFHHWIYIKLAEHFKLGNKVELAHFILTEALKNRVFDENKLKETLKRLPAFEQRYSRGDMLAVLNQKNIHLFGKVWNKFNEVLYYEEHLPKEFTNFEMKRIMEMKQNENMQIKDEIRIPPGGQKREIEGRDSPFIEWYVYGENASDKLAVLNGTVEPNAELHFNGFIYLVQEVNEEWFTTIKIAESSEYGNTLAAKSFCFRKINRNSVDLSKKVGDFEYCMSGLDVYVIFEFDKLIMLKDALEMSVQSVLYFYLRQVLDIILEYERHQISFVELNFFVDSEFNVKPFSFLLAPYEGRARTADLISGLFGNLNMEISENFEQMVVECERFLTSQTFKLELLRHKEKVLDTI